MTERIEAGQAGRQQQRTGDMAPRCRGVVERFRTTSSGWQTRINDVLKDWAKQHYREACLGQPHDCSTPFGLQRGALKPSADHDFQFISQIKVLGFLQAQKIKYLLTRSFPFRITAHAPVFVVEMLGQSRNGDQGEGLLRNRPLVAKNAQVMVKADGLADRGRKKPAFGNQIAKRCVVGGVPLILDIRRALVSGCIEHAQCLPVIR